MKNNSLMVIFVIFLMRARTNFVFIYYGSDDSFFYFYFNPLTY